LNFFEIRKNAERSVFSQIEAPEALGCPPVGGTQGFFWLNKYIRQDSWRVLLKS